MPPVAITIDTEFPDQPAGDPLGALRGVLDVLAGRDIKATFFVVGAWARAHPDQVLSIRDAGHHIGNHGYSHCSLSRMTETGIIEDLHACDEVLSALGVDSRPWFRAPYGELSHPEVDVPAAIKRAGYDHIHWHARGEDWRPDASAESIAAASVADVRRRWPRPAIVLLHSWPDATPAALVRLIDALEPEGATFLTVDQLGWRHAVAGRIREAVTRPAAD